MVHARELEERHRALVLRSAQLRVRVAWHGAELARAAAPLLTTADVGLTGGRWLKRHPWAVAAVAAALALRRPRVALRWLRRAIGAWRWLQIVRAWSNG
jgi:hypothetical protein